MVWGKQVNVKDLGADLQMLRGDPRENPPLPHRSPSWTMASSHREHFLWRMPRNQPAEAWRDLWGATTYTLARISSNSQMWLISRLEKMPRNGAAAGASPVPQMAMKPPSWGGGMRLKPTVWMLNRYDMTSSRQIVADLSPLPHAPRSWMWQRRYLLHCWEVLLRRTSTSGICWSPFWVNWIVALTTQSQRNKHK